MYSLIFLAIAAFTLCILITPFIRNGFQKFGILDHANELRKTHTSPVPRIGGICIALSYMGAFALLLFCHWLVATGRWKRLYERLPSPAKARARDVLFGVVLLLRMGHEENSGRGGNWSDRWDKVRDAIGRRRQPMLVKEAA